MTNMDDAFGRALYDHYYEDARNRCLIRRDDDYWDEAQLSPYFYPYEDWKQLTREAVAYIDGGSVLDVGCGAGRHSLHFQEEGLDVTAIDRSPHAIEVCRDRGVDNCMITDMNDMSFGPNSFENVLVVGDIIGMGTSIADVRERLRNLARVTTEDATLVVDSQDPTYTDNSPHRDYYEAHRIEGLDAATVKFRVEYGDLIEDWLNIIFMSPEELAAVAEDTPWTVERTLCPDNRSSWYSLNHGWYFTVLEKASSE